MNRPPTPPAALLPAFDTAAVPFSTRGSWCDISPVVGPHLTAPDLHLVSHRGAMTPVLSLVPLDAAGVRAAVRVTATPALLTWHTEEGTVEAVFESPDTVRLRGRGAALRLRDGVPPAPFAGSHFFADPVDGAYVFGSEETGCRYRVTGLGTTVRAEPGRSRPHGVVVGAGEAGWEAVIEETGTVRAPCRAPHGFDATVERAARDFAEYAEALTSWRTAETPAAVLAAYVLWSGTVRPDGLLGRESVLMSKHWMDKVWSWDHCFNALALAPGLPRAALDQFGVVFDHQEPSGALPDFVGHSALSRTFVKPPVHGWAFARLRELLPPLGPEELGQAYEWLARLTRFWLDHRRAPGHPLPYYQHGNDSGWDNASLFDHGLPCESPDLAALLAVQLDELAALADELGRESAGWRAEGERLTRALVAELWRDGEFAARRLPDGARGTSTSLLRLLPLVLAGRLPQETTRRLVESLRAHLTPWGLATEHPESPRYRPDGYWRGPVWGPSTVLLEDALRRLGETELADRVSAGYLRVCEESGFAENFDAHTGEGLRDRCYTWTAACYLLLARREAGRSGAGRDAR